MFKNLIIFFTPSTRSTLSQAISVFAWLTTVESNLTSLLLPSRPIVFSTPLFRSHPPGPSSFPSQRKAKILTIALKALQDLLLTLPNLTHFLLAHSTPAILAWLFFFFTLSKVISCLRSFCLISLLGNTTKQHLGTCSMPGAEFRVLKILINSHLYVLIRSILVLQLS